MLVTTHQECRDNLVFFTKMKSSDEITGLFNLTQVVYKFEHDYDYIANTGSKFVFWTNRNAPNYQLVTIDFDWSPNAEFLAKSEPWPMTTLVPELKDEVLEWATCTNETQLVLGYLKDVKSALYVHSLDSGDRICQIPPL